MSHKITLRVTRVRRRVIQMNELAQRLYCPICKREVEMLTKAQGIRLLGISDQALLLYVATGDVHAIRTIGGNFWVCKDSLFL